MISRSLLFAVGVVAAGVMPAGAAGLVVPFEAPSDVIEVQGWPGGPGHPPGGHGPGHPPGGPGILVPPSGASPLADYGYPTPPSSAMPGMQPHPHGGYGGVAPWGGGPGYWYDDQPRPKVVHRVSVREARRSLYDRGYDDVRLTEDRGDSYMFTAYDRRDRRVWIKVSAYSGEVLKVGRY